MILGNSMKKVISIFIFLVSQHVFADAVATVIFTAKKVVAQGGGGDRTLSRGSSLSAGDSIVTSADATARIKYLNGTLVTIGSDSNYKIISYAPPKSDVVINAELTRGKIQSETAGDKKREALKTPIVALAITGTKFNVLVGGPSKTNVQVINGEVQVNGVAWRAGQSFVATPMGISPAPFPAAGNIIVTPAMSAATASSGGSTSTSSSSSASSSSSSSSATTVGLVSSTVVASSTTSSTTQANTGLDGSTAAVISIAECLPST